MPASPAGSGKSLGRPLASTRESLVAQAVAIAEEGGIAAVSLRKLADRAGLAPNALYSYFCDRNELYDAVVTEVAERAYRAPEEMRDLAAGEALRLYAHDLRQLLQQQPAFLESFLRRPVISPRALALFEAVLERLHAHGLDAVNAMDAFLAVRDMTIGYSARELGRRDAPHPPSGLASLPESVQHLAVGDDPRQFDRALDVVIRGALAER